MVFVNPRDGRLLSEAEVQADVRKRLLEAREEAMASFDFSSGTFRRNGRIAVEAERLKGEIIAAKNSPAAVEFGRQWRLRQAGPFVVDGEYQ